MHPDTLRYVFGVVAVCAFALAAVRAAEGAYEAAFVGGAIAAFAAYRLYRLRGNDPPNA